VTDDTDFMWGAYKAARSSPDVSTQNGALLLARTGEVVFGWNTLPPQLHDGNGRLEGDNKYDWTIHAETAVILRAAAIGVATERATMFVPWYCCVRCAVSIIHAGVTRVVGHWPYREVANRRNPKWAHTTLEGVEALREAGVKTDWIFSRLDAPAVKVAGELFDPAVAVDDE
jgi:dCMP deaminase